MAPDGIIAMVVRDILNFTDGKRGGYYPYTLLAGPKYQAMLKQHGLRLTDTIVWVQSPLELAPEDASWGYSHKSNHTAYRISCNHQLIYIFRYAGVREAPPADAAARSRLTKAEWADWTKGVWHIERASHHLILPEELVRRLVKMYSYEGDTVLDPFLGSGTTVKIARELGRKAFGYEREPGCDSAIMKTLGIEAPASAKGMVAYAKDVFAADGHPDGAEKAPKPVPESFTSLSPKVISDLLLKGDSKAEADEENPEAAA
jgi:DNA modification methylase